MRLRRAAQARAGHRCYKRDGYQFFGGPARPDRFVRYNHGRQGSLRGGGLAKAKPIASQGQMSGLRIGDAYLVTVILCIRV